MSDVEQILYSNNTQERVVVDHCSPEGYVCVDTVCRALRDGNLRECFFQDSEHVKDEHVVGGCEFSVCVRSRQEHHVHTEVKCRL